MRKNERRKAVPAFPNHDMRLVPEVPQHPQIRLVASDMDLTMTDALWRFYIPTLEEESHRIAKIIREPDPTKIIREIGRVAQACGTHEDPWFLERSEIRRRYKGSARKFRQQIVEPFWNKLAENQARNSHPYPFVVEVLTALRDSGLPVVVISDAPMYMVKQRVLATGLDKLLTAIYAIDIEPSGDAALGHEDLLHGQEMLKQFMDMPLSCPCRILPKAHRKPSPNGLQQAADDQGVKNPAQVLFIGDTLDKDGGAALQFGARFIWALYGQYSFTFTDRILIEHQMNNDDPSGTPPPAFHRAGGPVVADSYPPCVAVAASFAQVLNHLGRKTQVNSSTVLPPSVHDSVFVRMSH